MNTAIESAPAVAVDALTRAMELLAQAGQALPQIANLTRAAIATTDSALMIATNEAKLAERDGSADALGAPHAGHPSGSDAAFLVSGGPGGAGHYAINAVDPAHGARPVVRAYGVRLREDYTSFAEAARDRDVLNAMWRRHGGENAGIETAPGSAA